MTFIARPIASETARAARRHHAEGDPSIVRRVVDAPLGFPCRHCLRDGEVGEAMLLFAHSPFQTAGPYAETGPVFVHERDCVPAAPARGEIPEVTQVRKQVIVRVYDHGGAIHDAALVDTPDVAATLTRFLEDADVAFAHVRSVTYGCFTYAVERAA